MAERNCENCAREDCAFIPPAGEVHCEYWISDTPAVNRWISVEDALPEDGQRVLICSKSKRLFDVVFRANAQMPSFDTKIFGKVYAWYCEDVIAWMPMPDAYEPPEKE